jgi:hypothetical protein
MSNKVEGYVIRKWFTFSEDTLTNETGKEADSDDVRKIAIAAVVKNPYAGKFSENLSLLSGPSQKLGDEVGRRLVELANGFDIESYGKSCIVGTSGEYEHGNACLTTDLQTQYATRLVGLSPGSHPPENEAGPALPLTCPLPIKMRFMCGRIMTPFHCHLAMRLIQMKFWLFLQPLPVVGSMHV